MQLQVKIKEIPENEVCPYHGELPLSVMPRLASVIGEQESVLYFSFDLLREGRQVAINGTQKCVMTLNCDRCLESFEFTQSEIFHIVLKPAAEQATLEDEVALSMEDLDIDYYQGELLDLQELLEEQSLLGLPMRNLCSETCKGRCAGCGVNLNQHTCLCPPPALADHPFAGLSRLQKGS